MKPRTRNEIRCYCRREPLLATYGVDDNGKVYIHVKVYKNHRIFGEVLVTEGTVELRCRECMRWFKIPFRHGNPKLIETDTPTVAEEVAPGHV